MLMLPFTAPARPHTAPTLAGDCAKFPLSGKIQGVPTVASFRRLRAGLKTRWVEMMVICLRLFYARLHPAICCSLVRHRAEIWERDQKPRQRLPFALRHCHGLANSRWLTKLATDAAKPGFLEVGAGSEKTFLAARSLRELSGVGENRAGALTALGARTFGDVAALPSMLLKNRFGIWGQKLWLFANGQWSEKLLAEVRTRTMISRQKTFSFDVRDYRRVLQFGMVELKKLLAQLRCEQLAPRELGVTVRFADFTEASAKHRFRVAQERDESICEMFAAKFSECVAGQTKLVRQLRLALGALSPMAARQEVFRNF
jgi:DNA polymerase-4